jgi:hypothetical protein
MPYARSKQSVNLAFLFWASVFVPALHADVIVGEAEVSYGTVVSATSSQVLVRLGCDGAQKAIPWSDVRSLVFDGECKEHTVSPPTAGLAPCTQTRVQAFKMYTRTEDVPRFGVGFQLKNGIARLNYFNNQGVLTGPQDALAAIVRTNACPTELSPPTTDVARFCLEPVQFAVNWSLDAAMPNTVFTRGFAVFVETLPDRAPEPSLDIRGALGTALTVWTSGLQKYRDKLGPTIGAYLQTAESRSKTYVLLTPPQVLQMRCRDNASMIVRVSVARGGDFAPADSDYLAKSQIEGRTVLLNAADHRFAYTLTRDVGAGNYDLIWVLAHELGHSFGLPDEYLGPQTPSIMNPDTSPHEITERDALAFARSLERSVQGTTPGYFNPIRCGGLRIRTGNSGTRNKKGK